MKVVEEVAGWGEQRKFLKEDFEGKRGGQK